MVEEGGVGDHFQTKGGENPKKNNHLSTMDPRVEMAFFTASTLPAENLNVGDTDDDAGY